MLIAVVVLIAVVALFTCQLAVPVNVNHNLGSPRLSRLMLAVRQCQQMACEGKSRTRESSSELGQFEVRRGVHGFPAVRGCGLIRITDSDCSGNKTLSDH